ncbi:hypothetical protein KY290_008896 [Solanum tuberosum]|uniref:MCM OB domain-containing protein n=1 Tax=Solanum tuberosum TaxID=4113 RepID=A0ABQ7WA81_SOLTU|nr:hypothetical protein KY289_009298 [Solanum tuberosum]KAH0715994.1 hypothetical protein KY284_008899 [Solanum tuberosum]KAH0777485.1 hypothetical protein KY290_008896 [Solanum tuberosum]
MRFNDILQKAISDEFLRFESYLKNACKRFVMELKPTFITDDNPNKNINVAFYNLPLIKRLRELTTSEIGKLVSVAGVVTRTSEVRPELLQGTFKCLDCGTVIKNVEQQFKYTEGHNYWYRCWLYLDLKPFWRASPIDITKWLNYIFSQIWQPELCRSEAPS